MTKRTLFPVLLLCCMLVLTGCACKHEQTEIRNAVEPTCTADGFTGDTYCLECDEKIADGEAIPATGHTEGKLTGDTGPTCTEEGYTGDIPCTVCGEIITPGEAIPANGHVASDIANDYQATCTRDGYTGDAHCLICKEIVTLGEVIPATGHDEGEISGALEATCWQEGYTGDLCCTICYETLKSGEAIARLPHTPGDRVDAYEATCTTEGYTGDTYCTVCGELVENGEAIPTLEHTPGEIIPTEATCTTEGYTGDTYCTVCGTLLEEGAVIPMLEHKWSDPYNVIEATCLTVGYSGDRECATCRDTLSGEETPVTAHTFENNFCTHCLYRTPGLYLDGELAYTWEELEQRGWVVVDSDKNRLDSIHEVLTGTLSLPEGIVKVKDNVFKGCNLTDVYLPVSLQTIPTFDDSAVLEAIYPFSPVITEMGSFRDCVSLTSFTIPEGIRKIRNMFDGCTALQNVTLPSTLEIISNGTFKGCTALESLNIPDTVTEIHRDCLTDSGLKSLILPAALTEFSGQTRLQQLEYVDFSACTELTSLYQSFQNCDNIREIILPPNLKSIQNYVVSENGYITHIDFPDGFNNLDCKTRWKDLTALESVVWPLSLSDTKALATSPNLRTIYYCGSELDWKMIGGPDAFPNTEVIFDYAR